MDRPEREVTEEWRPIRGYEGLYEVSSFGRVKSLSRTMPHKIHGAWHIRERILKQNWAGPKDSQYLIVFLHKGKGEQHIFRVHRLVADAFLPKVQGKDFVNHMDCNRSNNSVSNLEWCTPLENTRHAFLSGRCENIGEYQKRQIVCVDTGERFDSIKDACKKYGVTPKAIAQAANGGTIKSCGVRWQFADEYDAGTPLRHRKNKNYSPVRQYDLEHDVIVADYPSIQEASIKTGIHRTNITACCLGKYHSAGGFRWEYIK